MNLRVLVMCGLFMLQLSGQSPLLRAQDKLSGLSSEAIAAMKRAATFYRTQVATHGGYVYFYTPDLSRRLGEGEATPDQIWVQPPGTPTVGLAYVAAYQATGDPFYLDAIRETAMALVYGQLQSGGWTNCIDFDPRGSRVAQYRNGKGRGKNNSSLDDGQTQNAIRFLVRADAALDFKNSAIHDAAHIGLESLLAAQFPSGGFPQVWTGPSANQPIRSANYPEYDWRTEGKIKEYWTLYTLNDNVAVHVAQALLAAHEVYQQEKYLEALKRLGDFLILSQMPEPQPAWAQQYNYDMQPVWARRFEPPAISGHESQDVVELLMQIYRVTGEEKYLRPIPSALAYLRRSLLPDRQLARYYELFTNRPLYMERDGDNYSLTYSDQNLPAHYGWKTDAKLDQLQQEFDTVRSPAPLADSATTASQLAERGRKTIAALDEQGRWISHANGERLPGQNKFPLGEAYISSQVFSDNLTTLAELVQVLTTGDTSSSDAQR